jgi:hypothetical protein
MPSRDASVVTVLGESVMTDTTEGSRVCRVSDDGCDGPPPARHGEGEEVVARRRSGSRPGSHLLRARARARRVRMRIVGARRVHGIA